MEIIISLCIIIALIIVYSIYIYKRKEELVKIFNSIKLDANINDFMPRLGKPSLMLKVEDSLILVWEWREWKGFLRGGTLTRSIIVVAKDGKVVHKASKNLDKPFTDIEW